ncbi:hypothetical protein PQE72_gp125 [Bacillus phage vB_BanS_Skywalker]|uniref:Uncharacterized protein n=1 Tax=Bacillus phage vB_BanS_Skywalker TaxID=2894789 RepID=A0AAE8YWR1_9CAUD|nr:hypothetical protein PQE72_gp125 [Bacillus phage vB_BanS_Skywalker]UGO51318.1 hypothetical protein SKYWALKER_161 [Bacillus phage vB_BanS_Skywalker]
MVSLKDVAFMIFTSTKTNEVMDYTGDSKEKTKEVRRLIKWRNKVKKKRIRKKLNKRIDRLVEGR